MDTNRKKRGERGNGSDIQRSAAGTETDDATKMTTPKLLNKKVSSYQTLQFYAF